MDSSLNSPRPLPLFSTMIYQGASTLFILIGILCVVLLCYRMVYQMPLPASVSPLNPWNEVHHMETTGMISKTPPADVEVPSVQRDHFSFPELSSLPHPTIRKYQGPFLNDFGSIQQTVTTNTSHPSPVNPRTVARRDVIQNTNGCRRHVAVWG